MEATENKKILDKVVDALRKAAIEIEEVQVQAALGKAEAMDKFEDVKQKFNTFVHDSKMKYDEGREKVDEVHAKIDELRVQLNLGKAETTEMFKEQKEKLLTALHELEVKIKTNETLNRIYSYVLIEIDMFKVQLEILENEYDERKESVKSSFEKGKNEFNQFIEDFKSKYSKKEESTQFEHFQSEVSEAFSHLKNAFKKP